MKNDKKVKKNDKKVHINWGISKGPVSRLL